MRPILCAVIVFSGITQARAADDAPALKGDLAKFQGNWVAKVGPEKNVEMVITFKDKTATLKISLPDAQEFKIPGEFKIDETAKPFKTIDWLNFTNAQGDPAPDNHGIYEFTDADTLRVCSGGPGNDRPKEFKAGDGGPPNLVTLKRQKDEPKEKDEKVSGDLLKMQGDWTAQVGPEKKFRVGLTVKGHAVEVTFHDPEGQERTVKGKIVVNESATPKTIDWVGFTRPDGQDTPIALSIYKLSDDEFTVCGGAPGGERPKEFKAGDGGPPNLLPFTRKK